MEKNWKSRSRRLAGAGAVFLLSSAALLAGARRIPGFGQWYAVHIYPVWVNLWGRISGLVPFSVVEAGLYGLFAGLVCQAARHRKRPVYFLSLCLFLGSALILSYTLNCGINYYRMPFSSYLGIQTGAADAEDLKEMCRWLTKKVNASKRIMDADEDSQKGTARKGVDAMTGLAVQYPALEGYYPRPKAVLVSRILSVQQYSGVYSPFTVEANYNREMTDYNIPYTICHELSHLRGFMREDEANFIGYLACLNAPFPDYNYSGYLSGWINAGNALAREDYEEYARLYGMLHDSVKADMLDNSVFWARFEGPVAETATRVNDTYLKAHGQSEGVKTYGRAVDLMLADFLENRVDLSCIGDGKMVE